MWRGRGPVAVALAGQLATACFAGGGGRGELSAPPSSTAATTVLPAPTTTAATGTTGTTETAATAPPASATFSVTASAVTAADLPASWRPGCPVGPERLRMLRISHWGFNGEAKVGSLVVHADVAEAVTTVFRQLFEKKFPIRRMEPVDVYGGDDRASMDADNTSGFNCRNAVASGPPRWSAHAFGQAIDVNPVENPYVQGGEIQPPAGAPYVDRSRYRPGMAVPGGDLTEAFASVGWSWGGEWSGTPDYQHFSATGG